MKTQQYYINEVKSFVDEYFPKTSNILITGSFNTPFFNETSDLDIVLISDWHRDTFVEAYEYNGIKMQIIMLPLYDIDGVIYRDIAKGRGAIISMLGKGVIIRDKNNLLKRLNLHCKNLYDRGPVQAKKEVIDRFRAQTTSCIEDLEGTEDFAEQTFTVLEAYNNILRLFLYKKRLWSYNGKAASREIKYRDEAFHYSYISSLDSFFKEHNKKEVLSFLKKTLKDCGGELHFSSTRNYKEVHEGDTLVVHIQNNSADTECHDVHILNDKFCSFLYKHIKEIKCFSCIYPINGLYPSGAYIIIKAEQSLFEEYIIPKIRLFHLNNPISIHSSMLDNWHYPFNINPIETFGTHNIQEIICNYLCSIHSMYKQNLFNISLANEIQKALYIFKHYKCLICLQEKTLWHNFWEMCFNIYIKTHLNKMLPTSNLEYIAEIKTASIQKEYDSSYKNKHIETVLQDNLSKQLLEIECYYMKHQESLDITTYSDFYATKTDQLFYAFFKLVDITLNMFFCREKALIAFIVMKM